MQKISKQSHAPHHIKNGCHQPMPEAIVALVVGRAQAGRLTRIMKVTSHIGIHGNEMADKLANEAAEECIKARQFDHDVSQESCNPFKHNLRVQQQAQGPEPRNTLSKVECLRNLHAQHKFNQHSIYYQLLRDLQPHRDSRHNDRLCAALVSSQRRD